MINFRLSIRPSISSGTDKIESLWKIPIPTLQCSCLDTSTRFAWFRLACYNKVVGAFVCNQQLKVISAYDVTAR